MKHTSELERFPFEEEIEIRIETEELSALCPFEFGVRDYYRLIISYVPDGYCVELRSFKLYIESFQRTKITHEELAHRIHKDLEELLDPACLNVTLEPNIRGGIKTTIHVG